MSDIQSYLQVLNEQTKSHGSLEGAEKATIAPLNTKELGVEEPEEVETAGTIQTTEEKVKYNHMKKDNVFEQLYKRAINEDFDDASDLGGGMGDDMGGAGGDMGGDFSADASDFGDDEASEYDEDPSHVGKVKEAVQLLQQALDILSSFEDEEEEEYEEYGDDDDGGDDFGGDDFGGDDEGSEAPVTEEETQFGQAKTIGHALVNRDAFIKGQTKKGNMLVKGANPKVATKKANPNHSKGFNGKPSNFSDAGGKKMQGKGNMKVPGRASNTGKFAFED